MLLRLGICVVASSLLAQSGCGPFITGLYWTIRQTIDFVF